MFLLTCWTPKGSQYFINVAHMVSPMAFKVLYSQLNYYKNLKKFIWTSHINIVLGTFCIKEIFFTVRDFPNVQYMQIIPRLQTKLHSGQCFVDVTKHCPVWGSNLRHWHSSFLTTTLSGQSLLMTLYEN